MTTRVSSGRGGAAPKVAPYAFVAPAVVLFLLVFALPIAYTVYLSLFRTEVKGLGLGKGSRSEVFVGLDNYVRALTDSELGAGALRVLGYGAILVPTMLGLALVFALLLDEDRVRARGFSRIAIFLPYAVPGVIASLLWGFLYLPGTSPLNQALRELSLQDVNLLSPTGIYFALANIAVWGGVGYNMVVLYTALRSIPRDLYEAARIDGCTPWQVAVRIKVPLLAPALVLTSLFSIIATLQVFAEPTTLAPLTNSLSLTWTPLMKVYQDAFGRGDLYSAAATSVLIALAMFVISFGLLRVTRSRAFGGER
ncbi:carbohydrate ABC transporter membrane protein 1 (CUT1 family) [Saccharothrix carnea]|uniref:Carbohydrate ABC transporter membrane protein 1 (CUT1 family) n=1 Tax=Saccharothrix carnea TaxID=1280637 RepID=A0A2P8IER3_SACCR|nr:sugar ABC transporter permease [Saccharothrix carnea]PSL56961.1 carbohydrate ABC transporter membrane protein 1 (CUT1 family) [Saccharothrix carnea]